MSYTVKDLVKKLLECDQDALLCKRTDNFEQGHNDILASGVYEFNGDIVEEDFADAFDKTPYTSKIIKYNPKSKTKFVKIS